uniref:SUN domain-containing protein n=1 Tax=Peronospora matthiolae TaxID=2874970 RepID=A0AAV1UBU5_9STRA
MSSIKHALLVLLVLVALASGHSSPRADTAPNNKVDNDPDHQLIDSVTSQDAKAVQEDEVNDVQTVIATETKLSSRIQQITEPEEPKADKKIADDDVDHPLDLPSGLFEVVDADSVDTRTRQNYASLDAGATILDAAPDTKSPTNVLVPDKDRYMLTPCSNARKWVVISLSEDVHADAIAVANYEKFSSPVKEFIVLGSVNYPTDTWLVLGNFTAEHSNGEQIFQLDAQQHVRYIKFRILSHYGSEYYCTLSQLRVFGRTFTQVISELERSIDAEVEALDAHEASAAPQLPALPASTEVYVPRISDPTELMSQCLMEKNNTVVAVFYDKSQQMEHYRSHGMCCLVDYTPELIEAGAAASLNADEHLLTISHDPTVSDIVDDGRVPVAGPDSSTKNESNVSVTHDSDIDASTTNGGASLLSATHSTAVSSTQSLGRLENIFVRITKKIQALEANQSVMGKQLDEVHTNQGAAIKMLQSNQETLNEQLKEIRATIVNLNEYVAKQLSTNEQTLLNYDRLLDEARRDNRALWNEMLIVHEVITTMKAGIFCAIVLSGFIISFYLLRLLFRCVSKCKERADLREWFWRMENHKNSVNDSVKKSSARTMSAGALRVDRKAHFGSSWDDSAIERKTLVSDMVSDSQRKFRRHHTKRLSQASLDLKRLK